MSEVIVNECAEVRCRAGEWCKKRIVRGLNRVEVDVMMVEGSDLPPESTRTTLWLIIRHWSVAVQLQGMRSRVVERWQVEGPMNGEYRVVRQVGPTCRHGDGRQVECQRLPRSF